MCCPQFCLHEFRIMLTVYRCLCYVLAAAGDWVAEWTKNSNTRKYSSQNQYVIVKHWWHTVMNPRAKRSTLWGHLHMSIIKSTVKIWIRVLHICSIRPKNRTYLFHLCISATVPSYTLPFPPFYYRLLSSGHVLHHGKDGAPQVECWPLATRFLSCRTSEQL